jgi:hypothetical protein
MLVSRRNAIQNVFAAGASTVTTAQVAEAAENPGAVQSDFISVKAFGAIGDGAADDTAAIQSATDYCFGKPEKPNSGPAAYLNKPLYFPPGTYKTTAPIVFTNVRGGHIFGAGRFATTLKNAAGTSAFRTNGFEYSRLEMMRLSSAGKTAEVLDLDWTDSGGTALQSNTFADMFFDGGAIGVNIGKSGYMGSENLFLNCFFSSCAVAGLRTSNFNALQNTLIGGNVQSCPIGVWVSRGSCSIYNTGFQISKEFDIVVDNSANDTMIISGIRSESQNFIRLRNGISAQIVGCSHLNSADGIFSDLAGSAVIESCVSWHGMIKGNGTIKTSNSCFGRSDWVDVGSMRRDSIHEVDNCYVGGTRNIGFADATFIAHKTITLTGSRWPSSRQVLQLRPGTSISTVPLAAGTRIQRVSVILDSPSRSGSISVGDDDNQTRYFDTAPLTGGASVSPTIECFYRTANVLYVRCVDAVGVAGQVAIDFVIES